MLNKKLGTRYEDYENLTKKLPFIINSDILRTQTQISTDMNWHENLEIEWIKEGVGEVTLSSVKTEVKSGDIVLVGSNVLHYTYGFENLKYSCVIIDTKFCLDVDIDIKKLKFNKIVNDEIIFSKLNELEELYLKDDTKLKNAKMKKLLLEILIDAVEKYSSEAKTLETDGGNYDKIKNVVLYLRRNYDKKITLDELGEIAFTDKCTLARNFKKITGTTIIQYLNGYRCKIAMELIENGYNVNEASIKCGFNNVSFFIKTYKKYLGELPSKSKTGDK